ncbi:MAG: PAC2 family protein [Acidimicrobiales bacterium]
MRFDSDDNDNLHPFRFRSLPRRDRSLSLREQFGIGRPVLIGAFEGWNDAGEAASSALDRLARAWKATAFCDIDPEDFFDFTEVRPEVNVVDGEVRSITWPSTTFAVAPGAVDVVVASGPEPQTHWKSYCEAFVELALELEVSRAIFLGAYLGEVTHRGPVTLSATSSDPDELASGGLAASFYEGPTGILAVLQSALDEVGIPATSIWASVPVYSATIAAKPALALAETAARITGRPADLAGLARRAVEYEQLLDDVVANDENVASFVQRVEMADESPTPEISPERLTEEIERYLRDRPGS